MPPPPELRLLVSTFPTEEQAAEVVRALVREQLVACGTLLRHARSIYAWQGRLEDNDEVVVLFKTTATAAPAVAARLAALHPYEVPGILTLSPEDASAAYGAWVAENVSPPPPAPTDTWKSGLSRPRPRL